MTSKRNWQKWQYELKNVGQLNAVVHGWKKLSDGEKQWMSYRVVFAMACDRYWQLIEPEFLVPIIIGADWDEASLGAGE